MCPGGRASGNENVDGIMTSTTGGALKRAQPSTTWRIATMNVAALAAKIQDVAEVMKTHNIQVMCLQETRDAATTALSAAYYFRRLGLYAVFGTPAMDVRGHPIHGVAIVTTNEVHKVPWPGGGPAGAAVGVVLHRPGQAPVNIYSVYVYQKAYARTQRDEKLQAVVEKIHSRGNDAIVAGDFNATGWEEPLVRHRVTGALRTVKEYLGDEDDYGAETVRVIDHICYKGDVHWASHGEEPGLADHALRWADLRADNDNIKRWVWPKRRPLREEVTDNINEQFNNQWPSVGTEITRLLKDGNIDEAWRRFSGYAEDVLAEEGERGVRRSQMVKPIASVCRTLPPATPTRTPPSSVKSAGRSWAKGGT